MRSGGLCGWRRNGAESEGFMAEYRKWEDVNNSWIKRRLAGRTCRACNKPSAEMIDAYVCCISHRVSDYRVFCVPCYEKRLDRKAGNTADTTANPYEIKHILKACKALKMKILVEENGSDLARRLTDRDKALRAQDYESRYSGSSPLVALICNFPQALSLMAAGQLRGGQKDPGNIEKHRLELFVNLAQRLKPFLPKVTGTGLNRLFLANREAMAEKHDARSKHAEWVRNRSKRPDRLFPLTWSQEASAKLLMKLLPRKSSYHAARYDTNEQKAAVRKMKMESQESTYMHELEVEVYNTKHGPRFIIRHNKGE